MLNKYQQLGTSLTLHEMKEIKGGAAAAFSRWECHTDPTDYSWIDYLCYFGQPPCPYPCFPVGRCQPGDYNACVS